MKPILTTQRQSYLRCLACWWSPSCAPHCSRIWAGPATSRPMPSFPQRPDCGGPLWPGSLVSSLASMRRSWPSP